MKSRSIGSIVVITRHETTVDPYNAGNQVAVNSCTVNLQDYDHGESRLEHGWWSRIRSKIFFWRGKTGSRNEDDLSADRSRSPGAVATVAADESTVPFLLGCWRNFQAFLGFPEKDSSETMLEQEGDMDEGGDLKDTPIRSKRISDKRSVLNILMARTMLMVTLAVLIGVITAFTWSSTTAYTSKSIGSIAFSMRIEILQLPLLEVWHTFNATLAQTTAYRSLAEYASGLHDWPLSASSMDELYLNVRNVSWSMMSSQWGVSYMTMMYTNGVTQGYGHSCISENNSWPPGWFYVYSVVDPACLEAENMTRSAYGFPPAASGSAPAPAPSRDFLWNASNSFNWYVDTVDNTTGHSIGTPVTIPSFNLVDGFEGVPTLADKYVAWHAYVASRSADTSPFVSCGAPVRHPRSGELIGIVGVVQDLSSVSKLIKGIPSVQEYGLILYLTDEVGHLLASSTDAPLVDNSTGDPSLLLASDSIDPVIQSSASWLRTTYNNIHNVENVHCAGVSLNGDKYYIDTFVVKLSQMPLAGVIVTPESAIYGEMRRGGHKVLTIHIAISVSTLVVGCVLVIFFTKGVSDEMMLRSQIINHLNARRRAEVSSTNKSQFLANMSHELRTPMAAIIGLLDVLLSDDYLTSEQVAMVSQIRQCSTSLLRLLNNILDLSKIESGKLALEDENFDLRHELEGLVELFSVQCSDRQLDIVLDLDDDIPRLLRGDSTRTVQIFANLIANSIKFTSSGYVVVRGRCEHVQDEYDCSMTLSDRFVGRTGWLDGQKSPLRKTSSERFGGACDDVSANRESFCLSFEVEDSGCGIDRDKWESVFDSFVQADLSTTRTHGGTGLGLCIVRSLVKSMGGDIKITQKSGPGTRMKFCMYFKRPIPPENGICRTFEDSCIPTLWSEKLKQCPLIFGVKQPKGRGIFSRWMNAWGLCVYEASTLKEVINRLEELMAFDDDEDPDLHDVSRPLVILDIAMVPTPSDLDLLANYVRLGVQVAWLLNHDTSSSCKSDLRERGYSIMTNKPLYKSKLLRVLKMLKGRPSEDFPDRQIAFGTSVTGKPEIQRSLSTLQEADVDVAGLDMFSGELPNRSKSTGFIRRHSFGSLEQISGHAFPWNSNEHLTKPMERYSPRRRSESAGPVFTAKNIPGIEGSITCVAGLGKRAKLIPAIHPSNFPEAKVSLERSVKFDQQSFMERTPNTHQCKPLSVSEIGTGGGLNDNVNAGSDFETMSIFSSPSVDERKDSKFESDDAFQKVVDSDVAIDKRAQLLQKVLSETPLQRLEPTEENQQHNSASNTATDGLGHKNTGAGTGNSNPDHGLPNSRQQSTVGTAPAAGNSVVPVEARVPAVVKQAQQPSASQRRKPVGVALKGKKILLAEDTPVLQKVAMMLLEKLGATVVPVNDGLQALDALTTHAELRQSSTNSGTVRGTEAVLPRQLKYPVPELLPYDLVLMDCQMPRMDGYAATRAIRQAERGTGCHIPIVALTAHAMSSDEARCFEVGMDAYLTKPIDTKLLTSTISSFTKHSSPFEGNDD